MEVNGSDAYILTNNHVAGGRHEMLDHLADGRRIEGGNGPRHRPKTDWPS
jgi:S1-C subfamily serine protease